MWMPQAVEPFFVIIVHAISSQWNLGTRTHVWPFILGSFCYKNFLWILFHSFKMSYCHFVGSKLLYLLFSSVCILETFTRKLHDTCLDCTVRVDDMFKEVLSAFPWKRHAQSLLFLRTCKEVNVDTVIEEPVLFLAHLFVHDKVRLFHFSLIPWGIWFQPSTTGT